MDDIKKAGRPRIKGKGLMPRLLTWIDFQIYEDYRAIYKTNIDQTLSKLCNKYMLSEIERSKNVK